MKLENEADVAVSEIAKTFVVECREVLPVDAEGAFVGFVECADDLQESGLARAGGTDDGYYLAFGDVHGNAFEHLERAEAFVNIA